MPAAQRFPGEVVAAVHRAKILGVRSGTAHRFTGVWPVVVEGRVFVRSWGVKERGWYRAFRAEPRGAMSVDGRELPARAVFTRSERVKDAVDRAYAEKYNTPASLKWVRDLSRETSRATTTELVPAAARGGRARPARSRP